LNRQLLELSRLFGIQTSYFDMTKQRRNADPAALLLVLKAMGAGVTSMSDVPEALRRRQEDLRRRKVEPVMVAWDGKLGTRRFELGYHDVEIKGQQVFVISAPTKAYFPGQDAQVQAAAASAAAAGAGRRSSAAPVKNRRSQTAATVTAVPRQWGIFSPVYALHSRRNPAAGDLTDFQNLMDWMHSLGGSVAGTLPLLGQFLDEPFEPSPYSPATRLFWNEFYIDLERIPEFAGHEPPKPRKTKFIDYRAVMADKRRVLEELSAGFFSGATPERLQVFGKFVRENKGVEDYARFRAVMDRLRIPWQAWPARLANGTIRKTDYDEAAKNYHLYAQWIIQEQLAALSQHAAARGQYLYLDLPLGLHGASYDIWRNREFFVKGVAGGAPPDPVFTKGQNWGFPPMNPVALRLNRYQYMIAYLRNHFRYAKLLRVDHVMGLHRLYWIPEELTGDKGVYVEYPADEMWAILSLESHRYHAGVVGENLGTVPPEVNRAMTTHDIRQLYVVQYEIMGDPDKPTLPPPPEKCVASVNTHDMPPFRAFLDGSDIDDRVDLGFIEEKIARVESKQRAKMRAAIQKLRPVPGNHAGASRQSPPFQGGVARSAGVVAPSESSNILKFLSDSMANIVLVNMEDLWEETLPQNVPATSTERPNWRRRARPSLEQIRKMAGIAEALSNVFAQRSRSVSV
jgi:4-alpha-glucanotransferase